VIVTPEQFEAIYEATTSHQDQLLVETAIESELRWGELVELHSGDFALPSRMLTENRTVVELVPATYTHGERLTIKQYPKHQHNRRIRLSAQLATKLGAHIATHGIAVDQLLFNGVILARYRTNLTYLPIRARNCSGAQRRMPPFQLTPRASHHRCHLSRAADPTAPSEVMAKTQCRYRSIY